MKIETPIDLNRLAEFIAAVFTGDWVEVAAAKLKSNPAEIAVVSVAGECAGFVVWNNRWFGPVGVAEPFRSYGLGKLLVTNAINQMQR